MTIFTASLDYCTWQNRSARNRVVNKLNQFSKPNISFLSPRYPSYVKSVPRLRCVWEKVQLLYFIVFDWLLLVATWTLIPLWCCPVKQRTVSNKSLYLWSVMSCLTVIRWALIFVFKLHSIQCDIMTSVIMIILILCK